MEASLPLQLASLAAAVSLTIIPLMRRAAPRLGLVDMPDARKVHTAPVPRVGGWGIAFGTLLPLLLWLKLNPLMQSFAFANLILFSFGVLDDRHDIGHWIKFLGQLAAAGVVVYYGDLYVARIPFMDGDSLSPVFGRPLTVFALVGVINAINHADGLDGLAAGESLLTLIGLTILGFLSGSVVVVSIALAAVGGILGFLRYNSYPAGVFMGDAGSQVLGFTVGFLAVYLTQQADTALSAVVPLSLLGLPIADILAVLYQRIRAGQNWFKATRNHGHHRLLDLGLSHYQAVIIIYSFQAMLVVTAVIMRYAPDLQLASAYLLIVAGFFGGLVAAEHGGWNAARSADAGRAGALVQVVRGDIRHRLLGLSRHMIAIGAPTFMLLASLGAARIPHDIGVIAALLVTVMGLALVFAHALRSLIVRLTVYVAAIASTYLIVDLPGVIEQRSVEIAAVVVIAALVVAIGVYMRWESRERFGTTPTDWLIVFVLVALTVLAGIDAGSKALVEVVICTVVLLYSCEVLIGHGIRRWNGFNMATLATLTVMAVRGLL